MKLNFIGIKSIILCVGIFVLITTELIYAINNPAFTEMQVFLKFKYFWFTMFVISVILILTEYILEKIKSRGLK